MPFFFLPRPSAECPHKEVTDNAARDSSFEDRFLYLINILPPFAEKEKAKRMARHMLEDKFPIESIATHTELSIEQARALQEDA